jgi:3-dehydroquinate synthase
MKTLKVELAGRSYPIFIGENIYSEQALLKDFIKSKQVLILTNELIANLYLEKLKLSLINYQVSCCILPDGEQFKTLETLNNIFETLLSHRFGRNATLLALGGGVVGDMGGFAAACYQRGIPFIQIPTSLLAQVDSSVGGKTGVNHALGKNMIGAFYQPKCVIIDTQVLSTLDARQFSAGLAEIIKYGLIRDLDFFEWLEEHMEALLARNSDALAYAIERSCTNKAEVVNADEFESGERATLNLGHTFGHAIETGMGYGTYLHGEAVAIGCCQAADLSRRLGWLSTQDVERVEKLLLKAGLPIAPPKELDAQQFISLMAVDKKNLEGDIRFILLKKIGEAVLPQSVERVLLEKTLDEYGR